MQTLYDKYLKEIIRSRVYDVAKETPLTKADKLSKSLDNDIWLKREDRQPIFSFKIRGAYNCMQTLSEAQRLQGVIASSAGNHAQGVAYAASKLKIHATIVMPETTPSIKIQAVKDFGKDKSDPDNKSYVTVVIHGDSYGKAFEHASELQKKSKQVFIPPYDDELVIAGQGTVGLEIYRESTGVLPDMIFVPVGGGGLIAGISAFFKSIAPEVKIIGVEPEGSACLAKAIETGQREVLKKVDLFADGVAVKQIGEKTWEILKDTVSEVVTVSNDEICASIKDSFEATRTVLEPSGALALAGLKKKVRTDSLQGKRLIAVQSGANMNFERLSYITERSELGLQKEAIFAVTIDERPGSFLRFCKILDGYDISEFNYRYASDKEAHVFVGIRLETPDKKQEVVEKIGENYLWVDLSADELSKQHIRYMVGGRVKGLQNERIYRFSFPERKGALLKFLQQIASNWNISLFHYRNHGATYADVLTGLQIPPNEIADFEDCMKEWQETVVSENDKPAYKLFLSALL